MTLADRALGWTVAGFGLLFVFALTMYSPRLLPRDFAVMVLAVGACGAIGGLVALLYAFILGWRAVWIAAPHTLSHFLFELRFPIGVVAVNGVLWNIASADQDWQEAAFNGVRILAVLWAGWLVARQHLSVWKSAGAGLLLLTLDHVVIKGGQYVLGGNFTAFGGVLISFAMYGFVGLLSGAVGGLFGRRNLQAP